MVRWLAQQAEALGVEIFPGFPAAEVLYNEDGSVKGVATGNMGIGKDGEPTENFQLGMELHAKYTIFAEGSRGHLGKQLIARFKLDEGRDPQSYSIGIKEVWEIDPVAPHAGPGAAQRRLAAGRDDLRRLLHVPHGGQPGRRSASWSAWTTATRTCRRSRSSSASRRTPTSAGTSRVPSGAKRLGYGARALTVGGLLSLPKTVFPGGALVGDDAGFLNSSRIKGSHAAIKTGMLAARSRLRRHRRRAGSTTS